MPESVATSETMSDSHDFDGDTGVPFELLEPILARFIGGSIYDWITQTIFKRSISRIDGKTFRDFWTPMVDLMTVSSTFRGHTMSLLCKTFGVRPSLGKPGTHSSSAQFVPQVIRNHLNSLVLFARATQYGAVACPPPFALSGAHLLEAYGDYVIAMQRAEYHRRSAVPWDIRSICRRADISRSFRANCRCVNPPEIVEVLEDAFGALEVANPGILL